ncbi:MAG: hypothetical protein V3U35_02040 [Candidatus Neomarinimicrobiota bacterium]
MVTRIIVTEISPQLEGILGNTWPRLLTAGLVLLLAGIVVVTFPRLIAALFALVLFAAAALVFLSAYHLWQLSRANQTSGIEID